MVMFLDKHIRAAWDERKKRWLFCAADVIKALSNSKNPRRYWSDLKRENKGLRVFSKIVQLKFKSSDGKRYATDALNIKQLLAIIETIPPRKAERIKEWLKLKDGAEINILPEALITLTKQNPLNRLLRLGGGLEKIPAAEPVETASVCEMAEFAKVGKPNETAEFGKMAKREGGVVKWVGIKCRITRGRNSGEVEIAKVVVYEDAEK